MQSNLTLIWKIHLQKSQKQELINTTGQFQSRGNLYYENDYSHLMDWRKQKKSNWKTGKLFGRFILFCEVLLILNIMQTFQIMLHFEHFSRDKNEEKLKRPTVAKTEKKRMKHTVNTDKLYIKYQGSLMIEFFGNILEISLFQIGNSSTFAMLILF